MTEAKRFKNLALTTPDKALALEIADSLPISDFYDHADTLTESTPGSLLRHTEAHDYRLPDQVSATRILYHSIDAIGRGVLTSGVVLIPGSEVPKGGWPVIAWAHGTTGVARCCAPSLMKSYYSSRLSAFLDAGFAIVATDYHGLGTEGDHQYCNGVAQGRDVVYSVKAAKQAGLRLAEKWVVAGHSQGSITAWGVAAEQYLSPDASYRGAIAVAGGMQKDKVVRMYSTTDDPFNSSMIVMVALGVAARFPEFELSRMLLPAGLRHIGELKSRAGLHYAAALYGDVLPRDILIPGWEKLAEVEQWFREFVPGERPVSGPILVTSSSGDSVVDAEGIEASALRARADGADVTFTRYVGLDHGEVLQKTFPDLISWIERRLA